MLIGGEVFPYEAHRRYFATEIRPFLGPRAHFLGPVGWARKRRLLNAARCLLAPSLVAETSSLVAMEAIACGTPVIAFPDGALADIVEPGVTGYLVGDAHEMARAIGAADGLDRELAAKWRDAGFRLNEWSRAISRCTAASPPRTAAMIEVAQVADETASPACGPNGKHCGSATPGHAVSIAGLASSPGGDFSAPPSRWC